MSSQSTPVQEPIRQEASASKKLLAKLTNGAIAGITGVSIIYPLDIVKTRLQNQRPLPNGKLPYSGIKNNTSIEKISLFSGMIAGGVAGFCQVIATNPMEIVKIQLQIATQPSAQASAIAASSTINSTISPKISIPIGKYSTVASKPSNVTAIGIVKKLGIRGLYKGTLATLMRDVPFSIIFFPLATLNTSIIQSSLFPQPLSEPKNSKPNFGSVFLGSLVSGVVAAVAVTPADVIKTRLQAGRNNTTSHKETIYTVGKSILKADGIKGLFKGAVPRALTTAPLFGIALMIYDLQQRFFPI
ncbi:Mitochondrial substrate carrier family protein X [Smittium culicis]|uniref:Mitochondrial substrate carrier family protein X n=1 Tax=Smittium culicis TaxID=133412 RepID=A0A1R1YJL3_9FUNG|nr:Mitochondrial substrate carrier family protein X [Smittium culicis]OMJ28896.1 Mitochondrial substrate carrier family protein X [Smittium culicis]